MGERIENQDIRCAEEKVMGVRVAGIGVVVLGEDGGREKGTKPWVSRVRARGGSEWGKGKRGWCVVLRVVVKRETG